MITKACTIKNFLHHHHSYIVYLPFFCRVLKPEVWFCNTVSQ